MVPQNGAYGNVIAGAYYRCGEKQSMRDQP